MFALMVLGVLALSVIVKRSLAAPGHWGLLSVDMVVVLVVLVDMVVVVSVDTVVVVVVVVVVVSAVYLDMVV